MKKVKLVPFKQKDITFYLLSYDPREIIKLVHFPEPGSIQSTQRPWDLTRVKEIAQYVAGLINLDLSKIKEEKKRKAKGFIPNCPILNIHGDLKITKEMDGFYILIPETDAEFEAYKGDVEILDGQHRLISFDKEHLNENFKSHEQYEMGYVLCDNLTQEEKTEIFIFSNDKQKTVDKNVLRELMRWLKLLNREDEEVYDFIVRLNKDTSSPLKNRISIGGAKIKSGFKILQVIKIFEKSKTIDILTSGKPLSDNHFKAITSYLKAWDEVFVGKFNHPSHTLGKISGLRYIMYLFPTISEILKIQRKKTDITNVSELLKTLKKNILTDDFFTNKSPNSEALMFRGETSTISLAKSHGIELKSLTINEEDDFDPNN